MIFDPTDRSWVVKSSFPRFKLAGYCISYVCQFKYLGHIINNRLTDDDDIDREIKNLFVRTNILLRKFNNCSNSVKSILFKSGCLCFYDIALWRYYKTGSIERFRSCYNRCAKLLFGYKRHDSLTMLLLNHSIPSFDTILHNAQCVLQRCCYNCNNIVLHSSARS